MDELTEARRKFSEYVQTHAECIFSESIALARWIGVAKQNMPFTTAAAELQIAVTVLEFKASEAAK
jgi:hypothetical protein